MTRLQATIAEAASHAHLSVSWTPPVDGNELAEQFHEMETWIGHVAEAGDMVRQELKALQVCMLQRNVLPFSSMCSLQRSFQLCCTLEISE